MAQPLHHACEIPFGTANAQEVRIWEVADRTSGE